MIMIEAQDSQRPSRIIMHGATRDLKTAYTQKFAALLPKRRLRRRR
jgi:hypothetical protein